MKYKDQVKPCTSTHTILIYILCAKQSQSVEGNFNSNERHPKPQAMIKKNRRFKQNKNEKRLGFLQLAVGMNCSKTLLSLKVTNVCHHHVSIFKRGSS